MANEFAIGTEQAFAASLDMYGILISAKAVGVPFKAILDGIEATSAVREEGGRQDTVIGTVTVFTADWILNGLKKGGRIVLPSTRECRIEKDPFIDPSGRGVVQFSVIQL